jgi:hypothetical protein
MPSLQDGEACVEGLFPGFHPGLFSFAPSGSVDCDSWACAIPTFARKSKGLVPDYCDILNKNAEARAVPDWLSPWSERTETS